MIFSIIILLLVAVIGYFHWVQGFFSATISAIIAIIAACLAVSYHETLVDMLLKGKMADQANAMMLCAIFGGVYIVLRLIFDKAVPGNLRFPSTLDAVGGGVMGVIAGIYATGVFALAAQSLPFGPAVAGYSRYPLKGSQAVVVPGERTSVDSYVYDELSPDTFDPGQENRLLIPVDDIVLATVQHLSDGGSLAGDRTLASIHPDYPQELFGQRLGVQVGAKHTAPPLNGTNPIKVEGVYSVPQLKAFEPEFSDIRKGRKFDATAAAKPDEMLVVVRIMVAHDAADDADGVFRFSPGSVRLVANSTDYYPIGTVDGASALFMQKPDDFLFLDTKADVGFDACFRVKKDDLLDTAGGAKQAGGDTIRQGTFVEVKRLARVDLSGKTVDPNYVASPSIKVFRKKAILDKLSLPAAAATPAVNESVAAKPKSTKKPKAPAAAAAAPATPVSPAAAAEAIAPDSAKVSPQIAVKIGVTTIDNNAQNLAVAGGTVSLKDSKLAVVTIDPTETLDKLSTGDSQLSELSVPDGKKLVQIKGAWSANPGSIRLSDSNGNEYAPNGLFTVVTDAGKAGLFMRYNADQTVDALTAPAGTPGPTTYLFIVPAGTVLKQVNANGQTVPITLTAQ
jgi:drug/metabolite transporter superfamily protein YnfA